MPTLVQCIARDENIPPDQRIRGHEWEAALELYFNGHFTLEQISGHFDMNYAQEAELAYLKAEFDSRNANGRILYFFDIIAATTALQMGVITEAKFRDILNLPAISPTTSTTAPV